MEQNYRIKLQEMEFRAYHGCYDLEQVVGNRFAVNVEITAQLGSLLETDDVADAVSYLTVYEIVAEQMKVTCHTVEVVASNIIGAIKSRYPEIVEVRCSVAKIAPPLGGKLERVSVELVG